VREEMRAVLGGGDEISFLDAVAKMLLAEARDQYQSLKLDKRQLVHDGSAWRAFTWSGDSANDALALLLRSLGISRVDNEGLVMSIRTEEARLFDALSDIAELNDINYLELLKDASNMRPGKWDWALSDDLARKSYVSSHLSFEDAREAAARILNSV
jgi:ATP-dependent Lhr-like helicase